MRRDGLVHTIARRCCCCSIPISNETIKAVGVRLKCINNLEKEKHYNKLQMRLHNKALLFCIQTIVFPISSYICHFTFSPFRNTGCRVLSLYSTVHAYRLPRGVRILHPHKPIQLNPMEWRAGCVERRWWCWWSEFSVKMKQGGNSEVEGLW